MQLPVLLSHLIASCFTIYWYYIRIYVYIYIHIKHTDILPFLCDARMVFVWTYLYFLFFTILQFRSAFRYSLERIFFSFLSLISSSFKLVRRSVLFLRSFARPAYPPRLESIFKHSPCELGVRKTFSFRFVLTSL